MAASSDYRERLCLPPYSLGLEKDPQITLYYIMNIRQVVCIYKFFKKKISLKIQVKHSQRARNLILAL